VIGLQDYLEIQELYARYNHCIDLDRVDEWVDLFTPDGSFVSSQTHVGREQLSRFAPERAERQLALSFSRAQHWTTNLVLEQDEDVVHGSCYLARFAVDKATGKKEVVTLGRYEDELVRTDAGWRFTRRIVRTD
jgi:SnoaL-like domain